MAFSKSTKAANRYGLNIKIYAPLSAAPTSTDSPILTIDYANVNKGKEASEAYPEAMTTLFDIYKSAGVISADEADGGLASGVRAGIVYDTRDKEGAPTSGIWAEAHIAAALPGISKPWAERFLAWLQEH